MLYNNQNKCTSALIVPNADAISRWLPAAIAILAEPFKTDNKQLNSLGKMVRAKISERHKDEIDFLYTPEAKNIVNYRNIQAIKKILGIA